MAKSPPTTTVVAPDQVRDFFAHSDWLDHEVLRPLSHIKPNWELYWDDVAKRYEPEEDSCADEMNRLIDRLAETPAPRRYHDNEDILADHVVHTLKWPIRKEKGRWIGADYAEILEQGGFQDLNQQDLVLAAAGRIYAAIVRGQHHIDDMEEFHQKMLSGVLTIILYHRLNVS